ncbi:MAG: hypothetical protein MR383_02320 [Lachnospiraceae bacterium]|nr:hypothetical protein [Lachnospiraceae bacterium]MDD7026393.1 hypothetical protein [Lachnospiraceae bacterium]MDY5700337.1 hypothetical protein [Lachnospiraceae bacterium]
MNSKYETWLQLEKDWIDVYCKKTIKMILFKVIPGVTLGLAVLMGILGFVGGADIQAALQASMGGGAFGLSISIIFCLCIVLNMRPSKFVKKISKNVKKLNLTDAEKEQLGTEMLEAYETKQKVFEYQFSAPGTSNATPARFVLTPHFCFLEGSSPYSILVRLSDIERIKTSEEEKITTRRGAKLKTTYFYTLYCIGFYQRNRQERGVKGEYPDIAMGFLQPELRTKVLKLLEETNIEILEK